MSTEPAARASHSDDERLLHKLGYAQELFRAMGGFQNFAISFTIISILAGCLTSYYIAFGQGGPVAITWGWLLVGTMSTIVALAMAEIASAYPTAGGLYYWASKLGSPAWGWFTGWFNLIGQIAVTAAIGYGLATFGTALLNFWFEYPNEKEYIYLLYVIFLGRGAAAEPAERPDHVAPEHRLGVLAHGRRGRDRRDPRSSSPTTTGRSATSSARRSTRPGSATGNENFSSFLFIYVFATGLLMAQYTITGFDASAHLAEETTNASRSAAVGMYMSVVASVDLRLHPARRGHVRGAEHGGRDREPRLPRPVDLVGVDEPELGRVPALHLRDRAVLLRDGVDHVGVADDVRVLARRRDPRSSPLAAGRPQPRPAGRRLRDLRALGARHGARDLELPRRLPRRHGYRRDRPLRRVHPPGDPALPARRPVRAGRLVARAALQVDRRDRDRVGRDHHRALPAPAVQGEHPGHGGVDLGGGQLRARSSSAARCCCSAAGTSSRRSTGSRVRCGWGARRSSKRSRPGTTGPERTARRSEMAWRPEPGSGLHTEPALDATPPAAPGSARGSRTRRAAASSSARR